MLDLQRTKHKFKKHSGAREGIQDWTGVTKFTGGFAPGHMNAQWEHVFLVVRANVL